MFYLGIKEKSPEIWDTKKKFKPCLTQILVTKLFAFTSIFDWAIVIFSILKLSEKQVTI